MTSADPSPVSAGQGRAEHGPTWPWALGSSLLVLVVLAAMLAGRAVVSQAQQSQALVPAPTTPPLAGAAVAHPAGGVQLLALDQGAGRLAVLTSRAESPSCPPIGACPTATPPDTFALLDDTTGATINTTPLTGNAAPASEATVLLTNAARHRAYAISSQAVVIFSTITGEVIGSFSLASGEAADQLHGAVLMPTDKLLVLTGNELRLRDATSGQLLARQALPSGMTALDGPVLDADAGHCFVLAMANGHPSLLVFATSQLQLAGGYAVPAGARLGTLDATHTALYLLGSDGTTWRVALDAIRPGVTDLPLTAARTLYGAQAFGANGALGHSYIADATDVRALDTASGTVLAALPLHTLWAATQPLPVDAQHGLIYVLAAHGSVVILHDGDSSASLTGATATLLARGALTTFITDPNQDPPFVSAETFPLAAGTPVQPESRSEQYWIHFVDRGWDGPHSGTASTSVASAPGQPGAYLVTFSISWQQVSLRQHTWICLVTADGAVHLQSDQGDDVP